MKENIEPKDLVCWMGTLASYQAVIEAKAQAQAQTLAQPRAGDCFDDEGEGSHLLSVSDRIATINVHGSLTSEDSPWNKVFGITSYNDIRTALVEAVEDDEVDRILLDIDSPGGSARGVSDLADFIALVREHKPVDAHVSGTAFSAAYWIASAADTITGPKMSEAGSIGVIVVLQIITKMAEKQGVEFKVFRAGKYKALGNPFENLSKEAARLIQDKVDALEGFFLDAISENRDIPRNKVKAEVGEGLTFFAQEAVDNGLMDEVLSFDSLFSRLAKPRKAGRQTLNEDLDMGKKVLSEKATAAILAGASDEEVTPLLVEQETASAEDETGDVSLDAGATDSGPVSEEESDTAVSDPLVMHLKEEVKELRAENATLKTSLQSLQKIEALEISCKRVISEYVAGMSIRLGSPALNMQDMDMTALLAQYEVTRTAMVERFPVGGEANVKDEVEAAPVNTEAQVLELAGARANKIGQ